MKIKENWINQDSNLFHSVDETVDSVKQNFEMRRFHSTEGYSVLIDGLEHRVLIQSHSNPINNSKEDKKIHAPTEANLKRGSQVYWNEHNEIWLAISKVDRLLAYSSCQIYFCNQTFKWQDSDFNIHEYPVILTDKSSSISSGLEVGKFITLADDQILIVIQNNLETKKLKVDKRIIFNNDKDNIYKITRIQDLVHDGLIYITMSKHEFNSVTDNVELGICDYVAVIPPQEPTPIGYSIVVNGDNTINRSGSKTYTAKVYADGVEVFDKTVVWSLSNSNGSVTSSTDLSCIVKGLTIGNVVLKAELSDDMSAFGEKTIQITGLF